MMENREKEHLLALKVMRLTRPTLYTTQPVSSDFKHYTCNLLHDTLKSDLGSPTSLEYFNSGNLLMLPQSFGNIYLGETFSCYMSVHNDSQQSVNNICVKADLQIGMQKILLIGHRGDYNLIAQLNPDESVDDVIHHEVKEIGTHILACTVSYSTINNEAMHFRKFFKFQVSKPLDVKTKFYNAGCDEIYLEAELQNITYAPMCLEKVVLEPSANFTSRQLNLVENDGTHSVFGEVNCLHPLNSRQYLFCLTPKPESEANVRLTKIGKLDIVWRTCMGERGRLQTSQLERTAPGYGEIRLTVQEIPSIAPIEKQFPITFTVTNTCERSLDMILTLHNLLTHGILWHGISGQQIVKLEPHLSLSVSFEAMPIKPGLQMISGIKLTDTFLKRTYDFDDVAKVFISAD